MLIFIWTSPTPYKPGTKYLYMCLSWVCLAQGQIQEGAQRARAPPFPHLLPQLPLLAAKNRNTLIEHSLIQIEQSSVLTEFVY